MSGKTKHPRAAALDVAKELTAALRLACEPERFIFAGSLRRMKPEVGDIELVYVPRVTTIVDPDDLLGQTIQAKVFDIQLDEWLRAGVISKRAGANGHTAWGRQNKLALHTESGIGIDFFEADKRNFWTLLVCRTGSAESNMRVCLAAESRGLKWNPYRGFEDRRTGELLFVPGSEEELFNYVKLPYLKPEERV